MISIDDIPRLAVKRRKPKPKVVSLPNVMEDKWLKMALVYAIDNDLPRDPESLGILARELEVELNEYL